MNAKKYIKIWFIFNIIIILLITLINYIIDPYSAYELKNGFSSNKIILTKTFQVNILKPKSIILGTSRAEIGYNPEHKYFIKPSYNYGTSNSSVYENKLKLKYIIKHTNLKQVLYVIDYRAFNSNKQAMLSNVKSIFSPYIKYTHLLSIDTLKDSFKEVFIKNNSKILSNGQRDSYNIQKSLNENGGHLIVMNKNERIYYKNILPNYHYKDTNRNSFDDFNEILEICYKNNIKLDIIFGPSHIRQWEALNYYLDYNKWLEWKKDIVQSVAKIAQEQNKKRFQVMDFSVYHFFTMEEVPSDQNVKMKYHWESSHYKNELGLIVLDRLIGISKYTNFGVKLNLDNIDKHLINQKANREQYINSNNYQVKVFGKLKKPF